MLGLILAWLACGAWGYVLDRDGAVEGARSHEPIRNFHNDPIPAWSRADRRFALVRIIRGPMYLLEAWADRGDRYKEARW